MNFYRLKISGFLIYKFAVIVTYTHIFMLLPVLTAVRKWQLYLQIIHFSYVLLSCRGYLLGSPCPISEADRLALYFIQPVEALLPVVHRNEVAGVQIRQIAP